MKCTAVPALALGLFAALTEASPLAGGSSSPVVTSRDVTPPKNQEFSLAMRVPGGTYVSLTAANIGSTDLGLKAGRLSVYPGSPVYTNESTVSTTLGYNTSLVLDLTDSTAEGITPGLYGLAVPDLGEVYGASTYVFAVANYQEFEFDVAEGQIFHTLTAASQSFYACNKTIDGETDYYLSWGVYQDNGLPPVGCEITSVIQNFNVPGGATSGS